MVGRLIKRPVRYTGLNDLQSRINELFDVDDWMSEGKSTVMSAWTPTIDVIENEAAFIIKADVNVPAENVKVSVKDSELLIQGSKEESHEEEGDNYLRKERSYGSFSRRLLLPEAVDSSKISAKTTDGVLHITIPKSAPSGAREIKVESS